MLLVVGFGQVKGVHNIMPRAKNDTVKSSAELDAELQEMQKKMAEKRKAVKAAKRREEAEARQAKAIEEAEFNKAFVEAAKTIYLSDYEDNGQSIYELVKSIIRPPVLPAVAASAASLSSEDSAPATAWLNEDTRQANEPLIYGGRAF